MGCLALSESVSLGVHAWPSSCCSHPQTPAHPTATTGGEGGAPGTPEAATGAPQGCRLKAAQGLGVCGGLSSLAPELCFQGPREDLAPWEPGPGGWRGGAGGLGLSQLAWPLFHRAPPPPPPPCCCPSPATVKTSRFCPVAPDIQRTRHPQPRGPRGIALLLHIPRPLCSEPTPWPPGRLSEAPGREVWPSRHQARGRTKDTGTGACWSRPRPGEPKGRGLHPLPLRHLQDTNSEVWGCLPRHPHGDNGLSGRWGKEFSLTKGIVGAAPGVRDQEPLSSLPGCLGPPWGHSMRWGDHPRPTPASHCTPEES